MVVVLQVTDDGKNAPPNVAENDVLREPPGEKKQIQVASCIPITKKNQGHSSTHDFSNGQILTIIGHISRF